MNHDIVVERGIYGHANDPSVVKRNGRWYMALSVAGGVPDVRRYWIAMSRSEDGIHWEPSGFEDLSHEVKINNAELDYIHRPSLNYNEELGRWEMYFDARLEPEGPRMQYLAVSHQEVPSRWRCGNSGSW